MEVAKAWAESAWAEQEPTEEGREICLGAQEQREQQREPRSR